VIALADGGARETVRDGETGVLYAPDDAGALASAVAGFDTLAVDSDACVANAARFATDRFREGLANVVEDTFASPPAPSRARRRAAPRRPPRILVRS
jgi:glycosyltransferase involved in cell wall biosynthesis